MLSLSPSFVGMLSVYQLPTPCWPVMIQLPSLT